MKAVRLTISCCVLTILAGSIASQTVVSPSGFATREGSDWELWPWVRFGRLQQVHGDLRGLTRAFQGLSFRRDGNRGFEPQAVARTLDAELGIGAADFATASSIFASNYVAGRRIAFARRSLNLPDWTVPQGRPAPFSLRIPFDTPYQHSGAQDLAWDIMVYANTSETYYFVDSHRSVNEQHGATSFYGPGCWAGGQTQQLLLDAIVVTSVEPDRVRFHFVCFNLAQPGSHPCWLLLGLVDPNLALPGLCTNLRCDPILAVPGSAPTGIMRHDLTVPLDPTTIGATVRAQGIGQDNSQQGLPFVLSNGASATIPPLPVPIRVRTINAFAALQSPTGIHFNFSGQIVRLD